MGVEKINSNAWRTENGVDIINSNAWRTDSECFYNNMHEEQKMGVDIINLNAWRTENGR